MLVVMFITEVAQPIIIDWVKVGLTPGGQQVFLEFVLIPPIHQLTLLGSNITH